MNIAFDKQREGKYVNIYKQKQILKLQGHTVFFLKVHADCERFPVSGKRQMSCLFCWRAAKVLESRRLVSLTWIPKKIMNNSQDDHKFSWKKSLEMSKKRRRLEATCTDSARAKISPLWNFLIRWLSEWGGTNGCNFSWFT